MPRYRLVLLWLVLILVQPARGADVPTPEAHLGYRAGADFHLARWQTVVDYFRKVDDASDRVTLRTLGETTEGRPYVVAVVSAPGTIARLDHYRAIQHALADPRVPAPAGADPVADGKTVVLITCSIHSTETASTFMAMDLLHELASKDDAATREVLDNTILLLVPSANPDGVEKVAAWYERSKGQPWEGSGLPELYHKYAGHDTNRDWFMLNLDETRLLTRLLYKDWFPTVTYDVHQMGSRGARLFVPPFYDPINPNLDPRIHQSITLIGAHMAADLADAGKRGVLTHAMYDNWWNGGNRTTPQRHNIVGVLTEAASVRLASPIFLEKDDLRGSTRGFPDHRPAINFVDPWPGGWWHLRDIVDYELICARSLLTLAARYRTTFQANYRAMARDAIARGESEPPFAWVVPADQRDPENAARMVRILHETGIEVRRARSSFRAGGVSYPAGSWILPAAQPYRAHLKDMMERQVYPPRFGPNGQPEPPYDVSGWTLPLQMGVRAVAVTDTFPVEAETPETIAAPRGGIDGPADARSFVLLNRSNDDATVLAALLEGGVEVALRSASPKTGDDREQADSGPPGFVFPANAKSRAILDRVLPSVSTRVRAVTEPAQTDEERPRTWKVARPAIGLYQPWVPSMDEGWTRLVLERHRIPYTTLHDADIRAGRLIDRVKVLLLPSIDARTLREGYAPDQSEPRYVGGLGRDGVEAIQAFVQEGGTLVCLEESCLFAIPTFDLPVKEVTRSLPASAFYGPGAILRARLSRDTWDPVRPVPLTVGMPDEFAVYFDRSLAFEVTPNTVATVGVAVSYAPASVLESGWLLGAETIQDKAALLSVSVGHGQVVLFGFPPQHRGQTTGTFRLLFNALLNVEND